MPELKAILLSACCESFRCVDMRMDVYVRSL